MPVPVPVPTAATARVLKLWGCPVWADAENMESALVNKADMATPPPSASDKMIRTCTRVVDNEFPGWLITFSSNAHALRFTSSDPKLAAPANPKLASSDPTNNKITMLGNFKLTFFEADPDSSTGAPETHRIRYRWLSAPDLNLQEKEEEKVPVSKLVARVKPVIQITPDTPTSLAHIKSLNTPSPIKTFNSLKDFSSLAENYNGDWDAEGNVGDWSLPGSDSGGSWPSLSTGVSMEIVTASVKVY